MKIVLDMKKSLEQNASVYFEKSKKAKKKLEGAREALERSYAKKKKEDKKTTAQLDQLEKDSVQKKKREKKWYEKFRWFISSEGFLCIGGRDATTNEIVVKKHTDPVDIICHTDMAGSPFFVAKRGSNPDVEMTSVTIQELTDATFCFSRAWKLKLMTAGVFNVTPDQVSKEAKAGEFIPRGAFMIRGKTKYLEPHASIAIGAYEDTVMCGPLEAVKKNCSTYIEIIMGDNKPSDVAKKVRKKIGGELDDIIAALPSGGSEIKK